MKTKEDVKNLIKLKEQELKETIAQEFCRNEWDQGFAEGKIELLEEFIDNLKWILKD